MQKNILQPISIVFLGVSILVGSHWVSQAIINKNLVIHQANPIEISTMEREDPETKHLLTVSEASELLGIPEFTLHSIIKNSDILSVPIPYFKIGNDIRFSREELLNWIKDSAQSHMEY